MPCVLYAWPSRRGATLALRIAKSAGMEHAVADAHQRGDRKQPADAGDEAREHRAAGGERQPREQHRARAEAVDGEARRELRDAARRVEDADQRAEDGVARRRTRPAAAETAAAAPAGRSATAGARSRRRRSLWRRGGTSRGGRDPRRAACEQSLNYTGCRCAARRRRRKVAAARADRAARHRIEEEADMVDKVTKSDAEWRAQLTRRAVQGRAQEGHRARVQRRVLGQPRRRALPLRLLRHAAVRRGDEVRLRHRLAQLLRADRGGERAQRGRHELVHAPHRGRLRRLRRAPRPRLRRRARPDRPALLHELGVAQVRAEGLIPGTAAGGRGRHLRRPVTSIVHPGVRP